MYGCICGQGSYEFKSFSTLRLAVIKVLKLLLDIRRLFIVKKVHNLTQKFVCLMKLL